MLCVLFVSSRLCHQSVFFFFLRRCGEEKETLRERGEREVFAPCGKREFSLLVKEGSFRPLGRIFNTGSGSRALPPFFLAISLSLLLYYGNVGAGYGLDTFAMESANQTPYVLTFDGKAPSSSDYEQRVILWERSKDISPDCRSTLLILHMDPTARLVCMYTSGGDALMARCAVQTVMQTLRDSFQPGTFGRIFSQMDRFTSYARTDQPIGAFLMEFGIRRQKAEKHMFPPGDGFEDLFFLFPTY